MTHEIDLLADARDLVAAALDNLRAHAANGRSGPEDVVLTIRCERFLAKVDGWQRGELRCEIETLGPATGQLSLPSQGQNGNSTVAGPGVLDEDCRAVVNAWNELALLEGLPRVSRVAGARATALRARLKEYGRETLLAAIRRLPTSDFLCGRTGRGHGWRASFDFLLRRLSVQKILEGNYDGATRPDTDTFTTTERLA